MHFITIMGLLWLVSIGGFWGVMKYKPRTLWSGFSFFWMLVFSGLLVVTIGFRYSDWIVRHQVLFMALSVLLGVVVLGLLFFPFAVILTFFVQGIRILFKEGFRWSNFLSLAFAFGLLVYVVAFPLAFSGASSPAGVLVYGAVGMAVTYLLSVLTIFCFSAMLNLIHWKKRHDLDAIIVLGAGILQEKVTPLLASRIDLGIKLLYENPHAVLILSGGQGEGETISESEAMYAYCVERGVDPNRMRQESNSRNTEQNLAFSYALIDDPKANIAIVTTRYHVFRALALARRAGVDCVGYGSKTKWYFTLNALLREFVGYLALTWRSHLRMLAVLEIPFLLVFLMAGLFN